MTKTFLNPVFQLVFVNFSCLSTDYLFWLKPLKMSAFTVLQRKREYYKRRYTLLSLKRLFKIFMGVFFNACIDTSHFFYSVNPKLGHTHLKSDFKEKTDLW